MPKWKLASVKPKRITMAILYNNATMVSRVGVWVPDKEQWIQFPQGGIFEPTHWTLLPKI